MTEYSKFDIFGKREERGEATRRVFLAHSMQIAACLGFGELIGARFAFASGEPPLPVRKNIFLRTCRVADLFVAPNHLQGAYPVLVKSPLSDRDVIIAAASFPTDTETVFSALAECLNGQWNEGMPLTRNRANVLRLPSSSQHYETVLWRKLIRTAQEPMDTMARYSRKPVTYWKERISEKSADPYLSDNNRKFLAQPSWHAHLKLWQSFSPDQRQAFIASSAETISLTPVQKQIAVEMYTQPGPYFYDANDQNITQAEAKERTERTVTLFESIGFPVRTVQNPVSLAVSHFPPFVLPPSTPAPFPVRGNPHLSTGESPAPTSYEDLETITFPADFRASDARHFAWTSAIEELIPLLPPGFIVVSDDFAPADAVLRRNNALRYRAIGSEPSDDFSAKAKNKKLTDGIDLLCHAFDRIWWRKGKVLHFRHQYWYSTQRYTPPPSLLDALKGLLSRIVEEGVSEARSLALLTVLGQFTKEQFGGALEAIESAQRLTVSRLYAGSNPFLQAVGGVSGGSWDLLQFFRRLSPILQREALRQEGLRLDHLSDEQRNYFPYFVKAERAANAMSRRTKNNEVSLPFKVVVKTFPQTGEGARSGNTRVLVIEIWYFNKNPKFIDFRFAV